MLFGPWKVRITIGSWSPAASLKFTKRRKNHWIWVRFVFSVTVPSTFNWHFKDKVFVTINFDKSQKHLKFAISSKNNIFNNPGLSITQNYNLYSKWMISHSCLYGKGTVTLQYRLQDVVIYKLTGAIKVFPKWNGNSVNSTNSGNLIKSLKHKMRSI